jgi:tetratricopeptide (TPR) repeat protein
MTITASPEFATERWQGPVLMVALVLLAALSYWPGLSGGFLFDDFVNLNALGATGPVDNLDALFRYLTSGTADPTGRPLALLSFLVDAHDWPADPGPFLRTNLCLHLLNGLLLWRLLAALGRELSSDSTRNELAAAIGAGMWLLHPLLVSTVLYIVQREAMLPATFVLAGLFGFVRGRRSFLDGGGRRGRLLMLVAVGAGTTLAMLCKANGALLPLLALVLEATVLRAPSDGDLARRWRPWRNAMLWLPSMLLLAYLATFLPRAGVPISYRGWSIGERLLTEGRVLADYLWLLLIPRSVSTGLYNDAYAVSRGLFSPAQTLPCLLLVCGLVVGAWLLRRRLPAAAAALLFYFAAQLLESTVVPLELYFEHRNYLPAMLLGWPLARWLASVHAPRGLRAAVATFALLLLATTTWQRAHLWGQPDRMAALWASKNPDSSRAQVTLAMLDVHEGRPDRALARLRPLRESQPLDLQIALNQINAACAAGGLDEALAAGLDATLHASRASLTLVPQWLERAIDAVADHSCPGIDAAVAGRWLEAYASNPLVAGDREFVQDVEPLRARLALVAGDAVLAQRHFDAAFLAHPTPDVAARQAALLAEHGAYRQALSHLDLYERERTGARITAPGRGMPAVHAWVLEKQGYWPYEMAVLRGKLQAEIAKDVAGSRGKSKEGG